MVWQGAAGWGEFSPFAEYSVAECQPWYRAAQEVAELGWPAAQRSLVPVNVTVPGVGPDRAERIVANSGGCTTAKVKVAQTGQDLADDLDRVVAVRAALGPAGQIRVDVNGAWTVEQAATNLAKLDKAAGGLQYVEQPCRTVEELAQLRRQTKVPIAADEAIRNTGDPLEIERLEAADVVVLKVQPLGGVRACLELAEQIGLPVVVSSAVESVVGIAMGLALAAALPQLELACGLATGQLLTSDLAERAFTVSNGMIKAQPALVQAECLDKARAAPATQRWWQDRLQAVQMAAAQDHQGAA
ncbi:MAG: o-succinylbenzoate synthase [Micrococcales bacterium]|nr:o-succinylbenzoate synthase [Micrococcales bacterium]